MASRKKRVVIVQGHPDQRESHFCHAMWIGQPTKRLRPIRPQRRTLLLTFQIGARLLQARQASADPSELLRTLGVADVGRAPRTSRALGGNG